MGNESEKKERWPDGKVEMMEERRGVLRDGHVDMHRFFHRVSLRQRS